MKFTQHAAALRQNQATLRFPVQTMCERQILTLVPKPRVNLTRFHGVFAPNSKHRALVTPAKRGKGNKRQENSKTDDCTTAKRHAAMAWAQRLKRVFTKSMRFRRYRYYNLRRMRWRRPGDHKY